MNAMAGCPDARQPPQVDDDCRGVDFYDCLPPGLAYPKRGRQDSASGIAFPPGENEHAQRGGNNMIATQPFPAEESSSKGQNLALTSLFVSIWLASGQGLACSGWKKGLRYVRASLSSGIAFLV